MDVIVASQSRLTGAHAATMAQSGPAAQVLDRRNGGLRRGGQAA
jgi:hypothetical protein